MKNRLIITLLGISISAAAWAEDLPQVTIMSPDAPQDTQFRKIPQLATAAKGEKPRKKDTAPVSTSRAGVDEMYSPVSGFSVDPTEGMTVPDVSAAQTTDDSQVVMPEITQKVILSVTDVNRIYCPAGNIPEIPTSQEKGIKISYFGKNATVKFQYEKIDGKEVYPKRPVELLVPCGDSIYQLIAWPKKVEMQTIRLGSNKVEKVKDNFEVFKGMPYERKIVSMIKAAYTDDIPGSFEATTSNVPIKLYRDVNVNLVRTIVATGTGFSLKEYYATIANKDINLLELKERDFLRSEFSKNIAAVAIDKLRLAAGGRSRIFVVEFGENHENGK